jgi:lysophospholipase L1-like esterase
VTLTLEKAAELLEHAPWRRVALIGDGLAEGIGDGLAEGARDSVTGYPDLAWVDWVTAALAASAPETVYLNLARGGALAAEVRAEQLDAALAFEPDLVAVSVGTSDLVAGSFDVDAVEAELDVMVTALRATGATVLTVGQFDVTRSGLVPEDHAASMRARLYGLSARAAAVADRRGALFVDYTTHPAGADPTIWSRDGVHLNNRGHAIAGSVAVRLLAGHLRWAATLRRCSPTYSY